MAVSVKICGLSTPEAVDAAIAGGASHVGFVFFDKSPRNVSPDQAAALAARVPSHIRRVGVFAAHDAALFDAAIRTAGLDILQLHGMSPQDCARERARSGREIWGALAVRTTSDLMQAAGYAGAVQHLLYDAKAPPGADLPGGLGLRFDWDLLRGFDHPLPWALAGGLDPDNVADAVRITGAPMVDVSSGVESAPGVKDVDKIVRFLKATSAL